MLWRRSYILKPINNTWTQSSKKTSSKSWTIIIWRIWRNRLSSMYHGSPSTKWINLTILQKLLILIVWKSRMHLLSHFRRYTRWRSKFRKNTLKIVEISALLKGVMLVVRIIVLCYKFYADKTKSTRIVILLSRGAGSKWRMMADISYKVSFRNSSRELEWQRINKWAWTPLQVKITLARYQYR